MRQLPPSPSLRRVVEKVEARVELVIACEGTETEPDYIDKCVQYYGAGMVKVRILEKTGVPLTVVKVAVSEREKLLADHRRKRDGGDVRPPFSVWAMFDRDEHEIDEAMALAKEKKIGIAFSNPCFELWPVLHLMDYGAQDGRHALQKKLHENMPLYHHGNSPRVDFDAIKEMFDIAYRRAAILNNARQTEGCESGCPSTTVGELVQKIRQNGRVSQRRAAAGVNPGEYQY
jgi:hypothetical protein